ncbi:prephenate dehydrogenase [Chloroflexota bacterium]
MLITIIGLGLIGGSLGLALKKKDWQSAEIIGYVRRHEAGQIALEMGAIDRFELSLEKAVVDANIIFIATPVLTVKDIFTQISPHLQNGCIVTDATSTKYQVLQWARELLPSKVGFVGGHPMAGKETHGIAAADADLFRDCVYCLVHGQTRSMQLIEDMIKSIGAIPLLIDAEEHDVMVAGISHLPLLISTALVLSATSSKSWPLMSRLASTGYHDLTRLASGNPEVNSSICLSNQSAIINWIDIFSNELYKLRELIGNEVDIKNAFTIANEERNKWLKSRFLK